MSAHGPACRLVRRSAICPELMLWAAPPPWHESGKDVDAVKASHNSEKLPMQTITTIDLDIAKSLFRSPALMLMARWSLVSQENRLL